MPSNEQKPAHPLSDAAVEVLRKVAHDFERSPIPLVDSSLDGLAEAAFVQGTIVIDGDGSNERREEPAIMSLLRSAERVHPVA